MSYAYADGMNIDHLSKILHPHYLNAVAMGLIPGFELVQKFGRNEDIDQGTVPEDAWAGGGLYTGQPVNPTPEAFQFSSSNPADTGTLTFQYYDSSYNKANATIQLDGTNWVTTAFTGVRLHTANYNTGGADTFNLGVITGRHATTTANVFLTMPIGRSQTNVMAYTVPAGKQALILDIQANIRLSGGVSNGADGAIWIRAFGQSPRLRRPFSCTTENGYHENFHGGLLINEKTDIRGRITAVKANDADVTVKMSILEFNTLN